MDTGDEWISQDEASRQLGLCVDGAIEEWVRLGLLRARRTSSGGLEIHAGDVRRRRLEDEDLASAGGRELTEEELRDLAETRRDAWRRINLSS